MTVRPIIFSAPMVLALLDGRKTMTRRLATSPLRNAKVDDLLYVRENFAFVGGCDPGIFVTFADYPACVPGGIENVLPIDQVKWSPSIHLPRALSRLTLKVDDIGPERLQEIDDSDAVAEGVTMGKDGYWTVPHAPIPKGEDYTFYYAQRPRDSFAKLWRALHGEQSWVKNPKVVALSFAVSKCNVDQMARAT